MFKSSIRKMLFGQIFHFFFIGCYFLDFVLDQTKENGPNTSLESQRSMILTRHTKKRHNSYRILDAKS